MEQRRLRIERVMDWGTAARVAVLLSDCPDGPTYAIQRGNDGQAHLFLSKRTYTYLETRLHELKKKGNI
jgi:hypothetical protein